MKKELHIISGTTAVGKTEYALEYAEAIDAEIISCDASLLYRGMNIGTAKPTVSELKRVKHHCIDLFAVHEPSDITLYDSLAKKAVQEILEKKKSIVVTGGSGFYLKSFFESVIDTVVVPSEIRSFVEHLYANAGLDGLLAELKKRSPEGFGQLDTLNPRRVQRALERCMASGKSLPELQKAFSERPKPYSDFKKHFILLERDREDLRRRVELRAEVMLESGLLEEVRSLMHSGIEKNPSAASAIGYRETIAFLKGAIKEPELLPLIIQNTNALVKKQRTWFRTQLRQADKVVRL